MAGSETKAERLDRELVELLQELRVVLPGVQVLFAFLLTVPFSNRFPDLSDGGRALFLTALTGAAAASVVLIAPSAFHRMRWRDRDKEALLVLSNRLTIVGLVLLAVSMACALYLVGNFIYGGGVAVSVAAGMGGLATILWFAVPLVRRVNDA